MSTRLAFLVALTLVALAGCSAQDEREWMKIGQRYTKEEFQRDYRECTPRGDVDEACLKQRGWVPVSPTKPEPAKPDPFPRARGRY